MSNISDEKPRASRFAGKSVVITVSPAPDSPASGVPSQASYNSASREDRTIDFGAPMIIAPLGGL